MRTQREMGTQGAAEQSYLVDGNHDVLPIQLLKQLLDVVGHLGGLAVDLRGTRGGEFLASRGKLCHNTCGAILHHL